MSEGAAHDAGVARAPDALVPPAGACANCGAALHGRFCAGCGQESKPLDPPVRHFAKEFAQELFDVDGRLLRSLRRLLFSPGFLTREHVEGRRSRWVSPLKLYLLASLAMFSAQALAGSVGEIELTTSEDVAAVGEKLREMGYANLGELQRTIETARLTWMPRVMFVLVPLFAGLTALLERRVGRRYPSHLVFALHVHAAAFVARALAAAASIPLRAWDDAFASAANLYALVYVFLAFRTAYRPSRRRAALDTLVVGAIYLVALVLATALVVSVAMFGRNWSAAWGS
jgi:hypothetical protein